MNECFACVTKKLVPGLAEKKKMNNFVFSGNSIIKPSAFKLQSSLLRLSIQKYTNCAFLTLNSFIKILNHKLIFYLNIYKRTHKEEMLFKSLLVRRDPVLIRRDKILVCCSDILVRCDKILVCCSDILVRCNKILVRCSDSFVRCNKILVRCSDNLVRCNKILVRHDNSLVGDGNILVRDSNGQGKKPKFFVRYCNGQVKKTKFFVGNNDDFVGDYKEQNENPNFYVGDDDNLVRHDDVFSKNPKLFKGDSKRNGCLLKFFEFTFINLKGVFPFFNLNRNNLQFYYNNESTSINHFRMKTTSSRGGTTKQYPVYIPIEIASLRSQ